MDESSFRTMADAVIARVQRAVDKEDPDIVEGTLDAGVLKLGFGAGAPFVLNLQPPLREVWLAADRRAWHFRFDGAQWVEKKSGEELYATLVQLVQARAGVRLAFSG